MRHSKIRFTQWLPNKPSRCCSTWGLQKAQAAHVKTRLCIVTLRCTCHEPSVRLAPLQGSGLARQAMVHRLINFASTTRRLNSNRLLIATGSGL